jgi:hypothetical protein
MRLISSDAGMSMPTFGFERSRRPDPASFLRLRPARRLRISDPNFEPSVRI